MKKNGVLALLIFLVIMGLYNVIVFMIFNDYNAVFWSSYGFMAIVYLIYVVLTIKAINSNKETQFMRMSLVIYSSVFVIGALILSMVFMILNDVVEIKLSLIFQIVYLAMYIICIIIAEMRKRSSNNIVNEVNADVRFIQGITGEIELLMNGCHDAELRKKLKRLYETVKYSDPMSNNMVAMEEELIFNKITELKSKIHYATREDMDELIDNVHFLFQQRNKKLIMSK